MKKDYLSHGEDGLKSKSGLHSKWRPPKKKRDYSNWTKEELIDLNELYNASGGLNEYELEFLSNAKSFQFVLSVGQEKKVYLTNTRPNILNKKPLKWREQ